MHITWLLTADCRTPCNNDHIVTSLYIYTHSLTLTHSMLTHLHYTHTHYCFFTYTMWTVHTHTVLYSLHTRTHTACTVHYSLNTVSLCMTVTLLSHSHTTLTLCTSLTHTHSRTGHTCGQWSLTSLTLTQTLQPQAHSHTHCTHCTHHRVHIAHTHILEAHVVYLYVVMTIYMFIFSTGAVYGSPILLSLPVYTLITTCTSCYWHYLKLCLVAPPSLVGPVYVAIADYVHLWRHYYTLNSFYM